MHKLNRNPISIDDNLKIVRKGLRAEQRAFFDAEKDNLKNAFENMILVPQLLPFL